MNQTKAFVTTRSITEIRDGFMSTTHTIVDGEGLDLEKGIQIDGEKLVAMITAKRAEGIPMQIRTKPIETRRSQFF